MDVIKFNNPNAPTKMEDAEVVNGLASKMWVERYSTAGEFKFTSSDPSIRASLPIGSFVSHVNSSEIMIVENHEINDDTGKDPAVSITGRGFETFFENRVVGSNKSFPISGTVTDYSLDPEYTWNQAVTLISDHVLAANLIDDNLAIPYISVLSTVAGSAAVVARTIKRGSLYDQVLELLKIDNLGIKVIRSGLWSPLTLGNLDTAVVIHVGNDKTHDVVFSYDTGEVTSADYLWSNKSLKNAALVTGKWVEMVVEPDEIEYDRRMMYVDASDLDKDFTVAPAGSDLDTVIANMRQRGVEAIAAQNTTVLTKAEIAKENIKAVYRTDFDVGDIIMVRGDYNETSNMRVSEYVEIEDNTGESGYPTLAMV